MFNWFLEISGITFWILATLAYIVLILILAGVMGFNGKE